MIKPFDKGNCHDTGLAIDLSAIRMADSSGIGLLMATYNSMRKIGGRLAAVNASNELLELFRPMRMHRRFGVTGNRGPR